MDKMNKKSIKSKFIQNIALTLVLSMMVFVACQKEVGIAPNTSPANSGLANKEVAFNPGIYDQAAGDPLFAAYYEATMQLKAPLVKKIGEPSMDKHLDLLGAAIENNNLGQVAELMGYESLECYYATIENVKSAASKLIQKYPSLATENSGAMEMTTGIFLEKYLSNANPAARLGEYNSLLAAPRCGSECKGNRVPDVECCRKAKETFQNTIITCGGIATAAVIACLVTGPAYPACAAAAILAELVCINAGRMKRNTALKFCCKDAPKPDPR